MKIETIPKITIILGVICIMIGFLAPNNIMKPLANGQIKPMGAIIFRITRMLGLIGVVTSLIEKKYLYLIVNLCLVLSFFLIILFWKLV